MLLIQPTLTSKKELPKPADIQKLREYCKKIFQKNFSSLTNIGFDFMKWKRLGQLLLCQMVKFLVLYWTIIYLFLHVLITRVKVGIVDLASNTEGVPKTVLTFIMFSAFGRMKAVVKLLPVNNIKGLEMVEITKSIIILI
jgi:hypothetical protein